MTPTIKCFAQGTQKFYFLHFYFISTCKFNSYPNPYYFLLNFPCNFPYFINDLPRGVSSLGTFPSLRNLINILITYNKIPSASKSIELPNYSIFREYMEWKLNNQANVNKQIQVLNRVYIPSPKMANQIDSKIISKFYDIYFMLKKSIFIFFKLETPS